MRDSMSLFEVFKHGLEKLAEENSSYLECIRTFSPEDREKKSLHYTFILSNEKDVSISIWESGEVDLLSGLGDPETDLNEHFQIDDETSAIVLLELIKNLLSNNEVTIPVELTSKS